MGLVPDMSEYLELTQVTRARETAVLADALAAWRRRAMRVYPQLALPWHMEETERVHADAVYGMRHGRVWLASPALLHATRAKAHKHHNVRFR